MNAEEIQAFSQSIAFHPIVAIGGLMVLISIARKIDLNHKATKKFTKRVEQATTREVIVRQDDVVKSPSLLQESDLNDLNNSVKA